MEVSVLIPIKNEPYINELIKKIHKNLKNIEYEIIVIDKSDIKPSIEDAILIEQQSDGLGNAVLEGVKYAKGDVIILMDGDGSHRPEDISKLLDKIETYDIVIGSRFVKGGKTKDKTHRKIVSLFFRKLVSFILGLEIEDTMSGFSAVRKEVYDNLQLKPLGYKINLEIMYKGKKKGYSITEVPIIFLPRKKGKSKVGLSFSGLKEVIRILKYILELKIGVR